MRDYSTSYKIQFMQLWMKSSRMDRAFGIQCHSRNRPEAESKEKHAGIDYNLTLCPFQSRLQHIYHGEPYARVRDFNFDSGFNLSVLRHSEM